MANVQYTDEQKASIVAEFNKRVAAGMSATKAAQGFDANAQSVKNWAKASAPKPAAANGTGTGTGENQAAAETEKIVFERRGWKIELTPPAAATTSKSELIAALTKDRVKQQLIRGALKLPDALPKPTAAASGDVEPEGDTDDETDEESEDSEPDEE